MRVLGGLLLATTAFGCSAVAPGPHYPESHQALAAWESPGSGYSVPTADLLAQAEPVDPVAGDGTVPPEGTPPDPPPDPGTDPAVPTGELTWDEIALPQVERPDQRLVIKTGWLTIDMDDPEEGPARIVEIADEYDGYVQETGTTSITIRVPAPAFEEVMDAIETWGNEAGEVAERSVRGEDVTDQYYDVNVRLRNALAMRERYLALLARAESVEAALAVERELERVTLEIEQLRGRLRSLRDRIADSTITVRFEEDVSPGPVGWVFYGLYAGIKWLFVWD